MLRSLIITALLSMSALSLSAETQHPHRPNRPQPHCCDCHSCRCHCHNDHCNDNNYNDNCNDNDYNRPSLSQQLDLTVFQLISPLLPTGDRELMRYARRLLSLRGGEYKIAKYGEDDRFNSNINYTIVVKGDTRIIYEGWMKSSFDAICSVKRSGDKYYIYEGSPSFSLNIIFTVRVIRNRIEVYEGNSTSSFNLKSNFDF